MYGRLAIIAIAAVGLYAVVCSMRGTDDAVSTMPAQEPVKIQMPKQDMKKDRMSDSMSNNMADKMPKMTVEKETRQLLAELKTIPVSEFAVNKMKYERLLELHPGEEAFQRKVDIYTRKLQDSLADY